MTYKVISASRGPGNGSKKNWRIFERSKLEEHFGKIIDVPCDDGFSVLRAYKENRDSLKYIRWYPDSELTNRLEYDGMLKQNEKINNLKFLTNSAEGFINVQNKEKAFKIWKENGINCPNFFSFETKKEFYENLVKSKIKFPFLLRLNNSVSGFHSYLIGSRSKKLVKFEEIKENYVSLKKGEIGLGNFFRNVLMESIVVSGYNQLEHYLDKLDKFHQIFKEENRGIEPKKMCVELVDTIDKERNVNVSFRIHVSGSKVISGYARTSSPEDWVAIMGKFNPKKAESWLHYNKLCERICVENEKEICKAVHLLGLNHQGLDIVLDQKNNKLCFLEVQPTYAAGYSNNGYGNYSPPFYNPSFPQLVKFLLDEKEALEPQIPRYYQNWLNKENHFDLVYKSLKEYLED